MLRLTTPVSQPKLADQTSPILKGLVHGIAIGWPLLLLIIVVALGKLAYRAYRLRRLSRSGIDEIDHMDGRTFEVYLSTLFRRLGYGVEVTRYRGDYGADLVVERNGRKTAVQAKRWSKRVGVKAVQEAVAAKGMYGCHDALVVANREFTPQARELASANDVELWGREALVAKLLAVGGVDAPAPERPATSEEARCVTCGVVVSEKVRRYCLARTERFGGRIYCFDDQRAVPPD